MLVVVCGDGMVVVWYDVVVVVCGGCMLNDLVMIVGDSVCVPWLCGIWCVVYYGGGGVLCGDV